jgi:hypothetical protein
MSNFSDIRTAIRAKLDTLTGTGQPIAFVYSYHKIGAEGYPSVTFEPSSIASQIETTSENYRTYAFDIIVQQEIEVARREYAIDTLVEVTDTLINTFDNDWTL